MSADPLVVVTVAGGLGLIPQWCAVMGAVSTDPPATLLAAAATLAIVRVALGRRDTGWLLLTGVLIGAAYAVKATAVFLVPMALAACLAPTRPGGGGRLGEAPTDGSVLGEASLPAALRSLSLVGLGGTLAAGWIHAARLAGVRRPAGDCLQDGDPRGRWLRARRGADAVDRRVLVADAGDGLRAVLGPIRLTRRRSVPGLAGVAD